MIRNIVLGIYIIAAFLLETTVFKNAAVFQTAPNILLVITVSTGFIRGRKAGMITGFICGFLYDAVFGSLIGFHALLFVLMGYVSGIFYKVFFDNNLRVPLFLVTVMDALYNFLIYFIFFFMRGRTAFFSYVFRRILPEVVFTFIITFLFYRILYTGDRVLGAEAEERRRSHWLGR